MPLRICSRFFFAAWIASALGMLVEPICAFIRPGNFSTNRASSLCSVEVVPRLVGRLGVSLRSDSSISVVYDGDDAKGSGAASECPEAIRRLALLFLTLKASPSVSSYSVHDGLDAETERSRCGRFLFFLDFGWGGVY
ncbi:hypothetical protein BX666DRAFT_1067248 [Dichotomocladium elegans]|nr:hypothetical protein BX666DRAFT_1067248 [Dichotomocladium elegans]